VTEPDDLQLLRAIRQGDAAAFQSLYRRHRSGLYSFALLHCGAPDVAADVVQDVFMGLLNDSYAFDPLKGMLGNFLYGVTRNLVLRHARQSGRWVQPEDDEDGDDGLAPADDGAEPLARLLDLEQAEHLRRYENLKFADLPESAFAPPSGYPIRNIVLDTRQAAE